MDEQSEALARRVADRARAHFESGEFYCAEAILLAVNQEFGAGLDPRTARSLAVGLGEGLGQAGCMCGALSGGVLSVSLLLAATLSPDAVRAASRELHDRFKKSGGSTCCRVLTKPVKNDPAKHFANCAELTHHGGLLAARLILERLPEAARLAVLHGRPTPPIRKPSALSRFLRRLADRLERTRD